MARGGGMKKSKYMAKGGAAAKAERKALGVSNMPASVMKALGVKGMRMGGGMGVPVGAGMGGISMMPPKIERLRPVSPPKPVRGSRSPGGAMKLKKGGGLKKSKYMSRGGGLYGK